MKKLLSAALPGLKAETANGKMLRGRLVYAMSGPDIQSAAAVELMHAGSLLHDDVIDNADLRRGQPAFWKIHGIKGAILFGDLHFFLALQILSANARRQRDLIEMAGMVCEAAAVEELVSTPPARKDIARRKTGPLFAFAAMGGAQDDESREALREAGFLLGTAYQLADDIYDATGPEKQAEKSLRRDKAAPAGSAQEIEELLMKASEILRRWPDIQSAWDACVARHFSPAINHFMAGAAC